MDAPITRFRRLLRPSAWEIALDVQSSGGRTFNCLRRLSVMLLVVALGACRQDGTDTGTSAVSAKAREILGRVDSRRVRASALTNFAWDTLCFERGKRLRLIFQQGRARTALSFDYNDLFVDEPYVAGSLADRCIKPTDEIVLHNKYPGHRGPVELTKLESGAPAR